MSKIKVKRPTRSEDTSEIEFAQRRDEYLKEMGYDVHHSFENSCKSFKEEMLIKLISLVPARRAAQGPSH